MAREWKAWEIADQVQLFKLEADLSFVDAWEYQKTANKLNRALDALREFAKGESQWMDGVECMHKAREVLKELEGENE